MHLRTLAALLLMFIISCGKPRIIVSQSLTELNIPARMQHYNVPGLSIAIIRDFTIDTLLTYGVQDIETNVPVIGNTRFQAASISKAVSAVVALHAVEKKQLSLTNDINTYLTSWRIPQVGSNETITLAHLLSHTAGMNVAGYAGFDANRPMPTITAILNGMAGKDGSENVQKTGKVGKEFTYSGGGYCIVQQALEDQTRRSFAELSQDLFRLLGLSNSSFATSFSPSERQRMASGHLKSGERIDGKWRNYPAAAGGLWTTATDLAKLVIEIQKSYHNQSNLVLSQPMTQQMLTPFKNPIYGLGFYLDGKPDNLYFSHNGNNVGFQANFIAHTQNGYGVVVMTNSDAGNPLIKEIFTAVSHQYGWQGFPCK